MRLIDADELLKALHDGVCDDVDCKKDYEWLGIDDYINSMPGVAAEEITEIMQQYWKKQGAKEFAEKLKTWISECDDIGAYDNPTKRALDIIDIELKEMGCSNE